MKQTDESIVQVPISSLRSFPNHPFQIADDLAMQQLVDSIRLLGVLNPVIIRFMDGITWQLISGHRRKHACELLGIEDIPAIVKEIDEDEATIMMVDSNFQRLPCSICGQAAANDRNSTIVPPVYKGRQNKLAEILFLKNIARRRVQFEPFFGRFTAFFTANAAYRQNSIITFSTGSGRLSAMCMASVICSMG